MLFLLACQQAAIENPTIEQTQNDALFPPVEDCASDRPPIVMIHGSMGSGDGFERHAMRFQENGNCLTKIFAFDWDTFSTALPLDDLDTFIDAVLAESQAEQVDLVGHSIGGYLSLLFIEDDEDDRVRKYIHVAARSPAEELTIPALNLYSTDDQIAGGEEVASMENVNLEDNDHFEVITSPDSFTAMYRFLYGEDPDTVLIPQRDETVSVWGKALYFALNSNVEGYIELYPLDSNSGFPLRETPTYRQPIGENGLWGPFEIEKDVPYEFRLMPDGEQIVHHFYRPISHENHFMRLRAKPTEGLAGQLLASIPFENQDSLSLVTYSKANALRSGRDSLTIDGEELLTSERASKEDSIVAMFHFDYDEDLQSGDDPNIFSFFPYFLGATDHYWDSSIETPLSINLNGNLLNIPRYGDGILLITL